MEKERLIFSMTRFDHYFDSVNNKASVLLTFNTFVVGVLVAAYPFLLEKIDCNWIVNSFLIIIILLGLVAMLITIRASTPFFSKDTHSMYYFLSISKLDKDEFFQKSANLSDEEEIDDLRLQIHQLSTGLAKKFRRLRWTTIIMTWQFVLVAIFVFILIYNFKH